MTLPGSADLDLLASSRREEWITVKEFAMLYNMEPKSVYEAIRKGRLNFEVQRLTTGRRPAIRIGRAKYAA